MRIQDELELVVAQAVNMTVDGSIIITAPANINNVGAISINQTTLGRNLSLPSPSTSMSGKRVVVFNSGTARFQMYNVNIEALSTKTFSWTGTAWRAEEDNSVGWRDTRAVNDQPQSYGAGTFWEFKQSTTLGITFTDPTPGTYVGLQTTRRYATGADLSGGQVRQEAESDNGFKYYRYSASATTWGPWRVMPRITAPTTPIVTVISGASTIASQTLLKTITDADSVTFQIRLDINTPIHASIWQILTVPSITGYQIPIVQCDGAYRATGTPIGYPAAPFMGNEACVYTANQVYIGGYTENVATRRLITLTLRYVKN